MTQNRPILSGAALLAFGAAFANIVVVLETGVSTSHLTGDIARISIDLVRDSEGAYSGLLRIVIATASFFVGCILSGVFIHHPETDIQRPYGRSIALIGLGFCAAGWLVTFSHLGAIALAASACGFQNSLATRFRGLVLRTTHLTGIVTDFGVALGMSLRGFGIARWKLFVPGLLLTSYSAGCIASCFAYLRFGHRCLYFIGGLYLVAGLLWTLYKHHFRHTP